MFAGLCNYFPLFNNYVQPDLGTLTKEAIISKACYIRCHVHSFLKKKCNQDIHPTAFKFITPFTVRGILDE